VSPETLLQTSSAVTELPPGPVTPFDPADDFDPYVMATYGRYPIALERGEGCRVWDTEGREYLDFVAGIATCTLGHAHPVMVETVTRQIQTLHHVSNLYYVPAQGALAKWLVEHSCADRAFFCNSGAEANEGAIKLARKYAHTVLNIENPVILTAHASFHGRTLATIIRKGSALWYLVFTMSPTTTLKPWNRRLRNWTAAIARWRQFCWRHCRERGGCVRAIGLTSSASVRSVMRREFC
jgi:acetylornithine aminotransferase